MLEAQEPKLPALFRPLGGTPKLSLLLGLEIHHSSTQHLEMKQYDETTVFCGVFWPRALLDLGRKGH